MINKMRTRWKRWLGQKTRWDKPSWVTLLDSNWKAWASRVLSQNDIHEQLDMYADRITIKNYYSKAIDIADMEQLGQLDMLYCEDKLR